jgi:hypothetical protein
MPPAGFEPEIPAGQLLQTLALNRSATGIGEFDTRSVQPVKPSHFTKFNNKKDVTCHGTKNNEKYIGTAHNVARKQIFSWPTYQKGCQQPTFFAL